MKKILAAAGGIPFIRRAFRPFLRNHASIFMLHRFACPDLGIPGHDPQVLGRAMEFLRREGVDLLSIRELIGKARNGEDISASVALTVDDGYFDVHAVAAPIFEAYDVPFTVFLTTGFLDGPAWLWWDKVRFMVGETEKPGVSLEVAGKPLQLNWVDNGGPKAAGMKLTRRLAEIGREERYEAIGRIQDALEVHVPERPTPAFAPLSWDQVREMGERGASFGPHTLTHPNLAELSEAEAIAEIGGSWERVKEESEAAVPVFCFPYGRPWSLVGKVLTLPKAVGLEAAVTAEERYSSSKDFLKTPYSLPRFGWPNTLREVRHITSGMSRAKDIILGQA